MFRARGEWLVAILLAAALARGVAGGFVEKQIAAKNRAAAATEAANEIINATDAYASDEAFLFPDSRDFHSAARNLAENGGYVDHRHRRAWRTPLYSILLALRQVALGDDIDGARGLNRLLDLGNVLLVYFLARRMLRALELPAPDTPDGGGKDYGAFALLAAALYAFDPWAAYFANLILAETLANTLTLATLFSFARWLEIGEPSGRPAPGRAASAGRAFMTGALAGLAALTKPSLALLPIFPLAFGLLRPIGRRGHSAPAFRRYFAGGLPMALGLLLTMSPWWLRNYRCFGAFVPLSTMGGFTLYESLGPGAEGGASLGTVAMPADWLVRQRILGGGLEIYAFPEPDPGNPDPLLTPLADAESFPEFRQALNHLALAPPPVPAPPPPDDGQKDGKLYLFAPDPSGRPARMYFGIAAPDGDEVVGRSESLERVDRPPPTSFVFPAVFPPGPRPPAWASRAGRINTDFAPARAYLEWEADRYLRLKLSAEEKKPLSRIVELAPAKWARLWNPFPNFADARRPLINLASGGHFLPLAVLGAVALAGWRRRWRSVGLLITPAVYLTAVHTVFLGSVRYRLPAAGCLAVLAALGAAWLAERLSRRGRN